MSASSPPLPAARTGQERGSRLLERWNPSVKLLVLTGVSLLMLSVWEAAAPAALWVAALAVAVHGTGLTPRRVALSQVPFALFAVGQLAVQAVSRAGTVLLDLGAVSVTAQGVDMGLAMAARTMVVGTASVIFLATTDPVRLMVSLHQNLRLPATWTYALLAGHRLLLGLPAEWAAIREAQRLRSPRRERRSGRLSLAEARAASFALLIGAMRRAERISRSLESRGLGLPGRTVRRPVEVRAADVGLALAVAAAVLAVCAGTGAWS